MRVLRQTCAIGTAYVYIMQIEESVPFARLVTDMHVFKSRYLKPGLGAIQSNEQLQPPQNIDEEPSQVSLASYNSCTSIPLLRTSHFNLRREIDAYFQDQKSSRGLQLIIPLFITVIFLMLLLSTINMTICSKTVTRVSSEFSTLEQSF